MTIETTSILSTLDEMKQEINKLLLNYVNKVSGLWGFFRHGQAGYKRAIQLQKLVNSTSCASSPEYFFKKLYQFYTAQTAFSSALTDDLQKALEKFVGVKRPANRELMALSGALMTRNRFMQAEGEVRIQSANNFMQDFEQKVQKIFDIVETQTNKTASQPS